MRLTQLLPTLLLPALLACGGGGGEPQKSKVEAVEVAPPVDATLTTEGDRQEVRHREDFAGVLPGSFPRDLRPYAPSTLVDFGEETGGASYVLLQTPDALAQVRSRFLASVRAAGWTLDPTASAYRKGGRQVRIAFEDAHPGTKIRIVYR